MASILGSLVGNYTDSEGEEEVENGQKEETVDTATSLVDRQNVDTIEWMVLYKSFNIFKYYHLLNYSPNEL